MASEMATICGSIEGWEQFRSGFVISLDPLARCRSVCEVLHGDRNHHESRTRSKKAFRTKMIVPVIAEGRQIDMELLAERLEERYGIVTVHSDVLCKAGRGMDSSPFSSGLIRNQGDDVLFKFGHLFAILHSPESA